MHAQPQHTRSRSTQHHLAVVAEENQVLLGRAAQRVGARHHHRGEAEVDDRHVAVGVEEEEQVLGLEVDRLCGWAARTRHSTRRVASGPGPGLGTRSQGAVPGRIPQLPRTWSRARPMAWA